MVAVSLAMSYGSTSISAWALQKVGYAHYIATFLYGLEKYGWVLTTILVLCFSAIAVQEYLGLTFTFDDKALYVKSGLITHREIAIPFHQIQTINIVDHVSSQMFGLCSVVVVTSATVMKGEDEKSEATFPLIHRSIAKDLRDTLLNATEKKEAH
jgi:uncharacterized membrane protein YdbT with pleckstrin-like domain